LTSGGWTVIAIVSSTIAALHTKVGDERDKLQ